MRRAAANLESADAFKSFQAAGQESQLKAGDVPCPIAPRDRRTLVMWGCRTITKLFGKTIND